MRFYHLALFVVLASVANALVSAKDAGNEGPGMAFKPTESPLMMSTVKPTVAPKINKAAPTKAMNYNVPPKIKSSMTPKEDEKMPDVAPMSAPVLEDKDPMIAMESNDTPPIVLKSQEIHSHKMQLTDVKPVQVTGFITSNGNIYEIEGKDGIGLIESRQNPTEEKKANVCNYGTIVIYSDVPCDQVTNVKVSKIEQNSDKPQESQPAAQSQDNSNSNEEKPQSQDDDELEDFNENSSRRRQQQNRNRRRKGNGNRKRQGNRKKKPAKTQQQRRQQQKKRQQMQRQQEKRRQQQQRQRQRQKQQDNNRQRNRNRNQGTKQQQNRRKVVQNQQEDDYYSDDQYEYDYDN